MYRELPKRKYPRLKEHDYSQNGSYHVIIWQESFYDEIILTPEAYNNIWQYIDGNPEKWPEDRYYVQ